MNRTQLTQLTDTQLDSIYQKFSNLGGRPIQIGKNNRKNVINWLSKMIIDEDLASMRFKPLRYRFYYRNGVHYCVPMSEHAHLNALVNEIYSYAVNDGLFNTELGTIAPF